MEAEVTQLTITCSKKTTKTLVKMCEICSKLIITTPERSRLHSGVLTFNYFTPLILLTLNKQHVNWELRNLRNLRKSLYCTALKRA